MVDDPSAALLIRVWLEGSSEFRARLMALGVATAETPAEDVTVAVASSAEDVLAGRTSLARRLHRRRHHSARRPPVSPRRTQLLLTGRRTPEWSHLRESGPHRRPTDPTGVERGTSAPLAAP